ncbi:hypothetical protein D3C75_937940 [compost metagenome]
MLFRSPRSGIHINSAQPGISAFVIQIIAGVWQFQLEAGFGDRVGPIVPRDVPVELVPFGEAAEVVADLIADLVVIDRRLQDVLSAANTHRQRFRRLIQAIGFGDSVAQHFFNMIIDAENLAVLAVPGERQSAENPTAYLLP